MHIPTYTPVHNWRKKNYKKGRYKVHIRATINRITKYLEVKIPFKVSIDEWTGKAPAWVSNTNPYAFEINNAIEENLTLLKELNKRFFVAKKQVRFADVHKELEKNFNSGLFNDFFEKIYPDPPEMLEEKTKGRYGSALQALNKFNPRIAFHELSHELFEGVKKYLLINLKLNSSTVNGYFNAYRKVVFWARQAHYITKAHEETIFENIKIKKGKSKKDHLDVHEILEWKNLVLTGKDQKFQTEKDLFLLLIYTGYYYNDLRTLLKTEVHRDAEMGEYITNGRYKNDELAVVPLWTFPDALEIIKKYRAADTVNPDDPESEYEPYLLRRDAFVTDQEFNKRLKIIAGILKWKRVVRNKLARFTNSQLYIRYGTNKPVLKKIRGHQNEASTDAYYEINVVDVVEGTRGLNFKEKLGI
ncbi:phage integrase SAM-like domain-containing protein [[Flexibacter] sp. ATCC 35208]|uniref:phage integrase SAM-like domain-containing protein n=1 Tax=[Flexibacter] sp. ATCC 35208 TaxID=1936242 RepID=UPI0009CADEE1|nr:phage integrase SAM-like domain-containing protein [[Flexibacter] sp. ATCC 35208]OMP80153.1 hypothetical protein BW716_06575 [[Flexibacter] sp. ATCC 35208]